jgi:GT2 family glycosyltransferase
MPYFMAVDRQRLINIGGYDEDFTGIGADDNDLTDRLRTSGCRYDFAPAEVIHLYHPKHENLQDDPRYQHNVKLWKHRKGTVVRNKHREWGAFV